MTSKTIFITGTSSGFGKLTAELLVGRGHRVLAGIRGGEARLKKVFSPELVSTGRLHAVDLHLDKPETFAAARREVDSRFGGKLDALINNAGYGLFGPLEHVSDEALLHQFQVNCLGPLSLSRLLLPALREARGRILNLTSILGTTGLPYYSAYSMSKFALEGATEALYYEARAMGVQVGLVEPGSFKTDFVTGAKGLEIVPESDPLYGRRANRIVQFAIQKTVPLSNPARVARLLVRLCERRRVPIRSVIGVDARLSWLTKMLLPESLRMPLQHFVFNKVIFRE